MNSEVDVVRGGDVSLPDLKGGNTLVEGEEDVPVRRVMVSVEGELSIVSLLPLVGHVQVGTLLKYGPCSTHNVVTILTVKS